MTINGHTFYEMPYMCGTCPFIVIGQNDNMGWCSCFAKQKSRYANIPKRCRDLFEKGFQIGGDLVIVIKE